MFISMCEYVTIEIMFNGESVSFIWYFTEIKQ